MFIKYYFSYQLAVYEDKSNQILIDFAYYEIKVHHVTIIYSFHKFLFPNKNLYSLIKS